MEEPQEDAFDFGAIYDWQVPHCLFPPSHLICLHVDAG